MNSNAEFKGGHDCYLLLVDTIIELNKHENSANNKELFSEINSYLISELKGNFDTLILLLKEEKINGYYEIVRSNFELSNLILFILNDKDFIEKRFKMFKYQQQVIIKENINAYLNEIKNCKPFENINSNDEDYLNNFESAANNRLEEIESEINGYLTDSDISSEINRVKNGKIKFVKFYNYFSEYYSENSKTQKNVTSFKSLCEFLEKDEFYSTLSIIAAHCEIPQMKHDASLIRSTTHTNNILTCEIIKRLCLCFFDECTQNIFEEKIKKILGVNYYHVKEVK